MNCLLNTTLQKRLGAI